MSTYHIATIPGDGIGKEVIPESVKVLETVATKCGFNLDFKYYDFDYRVKYDSLSQGKKCCVITG